VLTAGLLWLYRTKQPNHAVIDQFGVRSPTVGDRYYRFLAAGYNQFPVVVVDVADPHYVGPLGEQELVNPLATDEVTHLALHIERLGFPFNSTWNGEQETGSVGLMVMAEPTLLAALKRYQGGCPVHGSVFCSQKHECSWLAEGTARIERPEGWS